MTLREVRIGRLVLRVPRALAPTHADEAAALARGIAAGIAPRARASRQRVAVRVIRRPGTTRDELVRGAKDRLTRGL